MKWTTLLSLFLLLAAAWALTSPDADPRARRLAASVAPPTAGIDPRTGQRIPHTRPLPGQVLNLSIKALGNFSYDPAAFTPIPADVKQLNGSTVQLSGYMIATQQAGEDVSQFELVPSLTSCCYGQPPGVQHTIVVHCPPNTPYSGGLVTVTGKLTVQAVRDGGYVVSLFQLQAEKVQSDG